MKNRLLLTASLTVSLLCVGFTYRAQSAQSNRPQWEYMTARDPSTKKLNELGVQGWEIVGVEPLISGGTYMSTNIYLKRAK